MRGIAAAREREADVERPGSSGIPEPDVSSVAALDAVQTRYAARGKKVTVIGLNEPSARLHDSLAGQLSGGH
ncbi:hypothetical protein [Streptosporangium sp. LJ11]|uniref:hypothetical protein n=1 Tax=Streptosporangium sp. LJ11 TaxID=3436927 RepID=UPI003F7B2DB7